MSISISNLKGAGETTLKKLAALGITTVEDLVWNFPRRYDDYSSVSRIIKIKPGPVTIQCKVTNAKGRYVRRGMHITEAVASDESGSVRIVWFNQPYRAANIKSGEIYFISGNYELSRQKFAIMNPNMELVSSFPINTARIIPKYRETKGLKSNVIRKFVAQLREEIANWPEMLPAEAITEHSLMSRGEALTQIHFPENGLKLEQAKHRLGFEEVYGLTLAALLNREEEKKEKSHKIDFDESLAREFVSKLPYTLTDSQRKVAWAAYKDMQRPNPMNRLIEGDVGSGKTVVATMSALMVMNCGFQVALMAPTELLARQHLDTLRELLGYIGLENEVGLLVGSMTNAQKVLARKDIEAGKSKLVVGTHALITDKVVMKNLALVIVDEQHRFGVDQRQELQKKAGRMPHTLSMTATPIPRTLALTLYGELDISIIDEKPKGRKVVQTKIVSPNSRAQLYRDVDKQIENGRQVFVVCPLIAESELIPALSVERVFESLSKKIFKHRKVSLLHGKMKSDEKEKVMEQFISGGIDILVSTTVIEVGVDVANASVMIIEGVERFGLAQIHQLRGRIGRSEHQGFCYLVMSDNNAPSRRIRAIESSTDGFRLAELDLELRGPGAIYGHMQHGQLDLRIANLSDTRLIAAARTSAQEFIDQSMKLEKYPELSKHVSQYRSITSLN